MRILSCDGYYGSGSSAINDLLSEYSCVGGKASNFECRVFFGVYGIPNLYNNFVVRNMYPNYAIRDYYEICKFYAKYRRKMNYEKYFDGHFMEYTEEYLKNLSGKQIGVTHFSPNYYRLNHIEDFIIRVSNKILSIGNSIYNRSHTDVREVTSYLFQPEQPVSMYEFDEEKFICITKNYLYKLIKHIAGDSEMVVMDAFFQRDVEGLYDKLFDDKRFFITNRDPRDVYITNKYIFKTKSIPTNDIESFCDWYRHTRTYQRGYDQKDVMRVRFEDMIYKYDETVSEIEEFVGVKSSEHIYKHKYFDPNISINNTRLWVKYKEDDSINYIEKQLSEWLYPFQ